MLAQQVKQILDKLNKLRAIDDPTIEDQKAIQKLENILDTFLNNSES